MHRRTFVRLLAARRPLAGAHPDPIRDIAGAAESSRATRPPRRPGCPGPYPGRVVSVKSDKCVDIATGKANDEVVREMMARGMRALTGAATTPDAWRRFFEPSDVVGIKVNCGGYPHCISAYEIVAETVRQLTGIGVPVSQIYVYERFQNQLDECNYAPHLPDGPADRRRRARQPQRRQQRLRSGHLPRGRSLRRRGHAVEHDAAGVAAPDEDHQHPEHEGSRRHRRHRVPEEHRLRQLLERRAHAPARQVAHLLGRRHAGRRSSRCARGRCCRSWTACAACGTAVRSRGRRATSSTRGRSCSAPIRSPSIACCSTSSRRSAARRARSRSGTARRPR